MCKKANARLIFVHYSHTYNNWISAISTPQLIPGSSAGCKNLPCVDSNRSPLALGDTPYRLCLSVKSSGA